MCAIRSRGTITSSARVFASYTVFAILQKPIIITLLDTSRVLQIVRFFTTLAVSRSVRAGRAKIMTNNTFPEIIGGMLVITSRAIFLALEI